MRASDSHVVFIPLVDEHHVIVARTSCVIDGRRGPSDEDARPVSWIVERMRAAWGGGAADAVPDMGPRPHEAGLLRLDCSKARAALGWRPGLTLEEALDWIVDWHKAVGGGADARTVTRRQIADYQAMTGRALQSAA